jgi:hypothetical protein
MLTDWYVIYADKTNLIQKLRIDCKVQLLDAEEKSACNSVDYKKINQNPDCYFLKVWGLE